MDKETADKAARWWAGKLQTGGCDNGDRSEAGALAFLYGSLLQEKSRTKNTREKIDNFVTRLSEYFQSVKSDWFSIGCDYGPDYNLSQIATVAGIDCGAFPWKTYMYINHGKVTVSEGYGAPAKEIE